MALYAWKNEDIQVDQRSSFITIVFWLLYFERENKEWRNNSKVLVHLSIYTGDIKEKYGNSKVSLKSEVYL